MIHHTPPDNYDHLLFDHSGIRTLDARTYRHSPLVLVAATVALIALLIGGVLCN